MAVRKIEQSMTQTTINDLITSGTVLTVVGFLGGVTFEIQRRYLRHKTSVTESAELCYKCRNLGHTRYHDVHIADL